MGSDDRKRPNDDVVRTEDLLAGFDRPGRTPRMPPVKRDFVDYHLDRGRQTPDIRPPSGPRPQDMPTAIIPHQRPRWVLWLPWIVMLLAMPFAGLAIAAWLESGSARDRSTAMSPAPSAPTTSVTRTSSAAPSSREDEIPPPPPVADLPSAPVVAATPTRTEPPTPRRSATAAPSATVLPPPSPATSAKPATNGEFIREM